MSLEEAIERNTEAVEGVHRALLAIAAGLSYSPAGNSPLYREMYPILLTEVRAAVALYKGEAPAPVPRADAPQAETNQAAPAAEAPQAATAAEAPQAAPAPQAPAEPTAPDDSATAINPPAAAPAPAPEPVTLEQVTAAAVRAATSQGRDFVVSVLDAFKVPNVRGLAPEQYAAALARFNAAE